MRKEVWVFPGQGSQSVGMGRELAAEYEIVRETFEEADRVLGFPLSTLCFEGPDEELTRTVNTQPALLATSVAVARLLMEKGREPAAAAGHSLGEYAALVVSGAISFADGLRTVRLRGRLMEEAAPSGAMAAVIGLDRELIGALCREVAHVGTVEPATYNSPGQVVVAGERAAVDAFKEAAEAKGARRVVLLNVSGPFHSSLLRGAGRRLGEWLESVPLSMPRFPVVSNVTGAAYTSAEEIKACLIRQVSEAVLWEDSIVYLSNSGFDTFVEVGPGRVLSGLIRRIHKGAATYHVESIESLTAYLEQE